MVQAHRNAFAHMAVQTYAAPMYVPVAPAPTYPYDPAYSEYTPMDPAVRRRAALSGRALVQ